MRVPVVLLGIKMAVWHQKLLFRKSLLQQATSVGVIEIQVIEILYFKYI